MPHTPGANASVRAAGAGRLLDEIDRTRAERPVPPHWRETLRAVPRDAFLPERVWLRDGDGGYRPCDRSRDPDGWMAAAYSDAPLITRFVTESDGTRSPSSSASQPSTVLRLLEDARLTDGTQVLEIGTGSGYNAALLCACLGADAVTTIEVDTELAAVARANLAALSYTPTIVNTDGANGWAPNAPYDRILATCSVRAIPAAWLDQSPPGGRIVAPWDSAWCAYGTVGLTRQRDGSGTGRFAGYGSYMLISGQRSDVELYRDVLRDGQTVETSSTRLSPWTVAGAELNLDFHIGLTVPGAWYSWDTETEKAHTRLWLADDMATSWASVDYDGRQGKTFHVTQHGPRRLWDEVATAHDQWLRAGRPSVDRYGLTVTPDTQRAWLDRPDNVVAQRAC
ncbi:rRNA adenine N-6-methyltransferase family protein [Streptomyces sp. NBC_00872]|uniref:rRNA adenine N-6-methyltransferase family protein n=1 Tax=Streptomyces sp. NBC_00872 TaxID=2903686 RepID=UPI00386AB2CD|nr:methyltransferase [Streptomyces sp. NBC_00872]